MVNFYSFDPFFWTQWDPIGPKMDPRVTPPWFGAITVTSICCKKSMFWVWWFLRFWPIFGTQWNPIGPKIDPKGSPPWFGAVTATSIFAKNRWPRVCRKFQFWGMVNFYSFDPFFWTQWDSIGPKMDPRVTPPWFRAITVTSICFEKSMTAG